MIQGFKYYFLDEMTPEEYLKVVDSIPSWRRFVDEKENRMHICERIENAQRQERLFA